MFLSRESFAQEKEKENRKERVDQTIASKSLYKLASSTSLLSTGIQFKQAIQSGWHHLCLNGMIVCHVIRQSFQYFPDLLNFGFFFLLSMGAVIGPLLSFSDYFRYAALGKTRSRYLLYKDVNRNPFAF